MESREVEPKFPPGGSEETEIPWTNHSTFQQVIEFTTHQEENLEGPLE